MCKHTHTHAHAMTHTQTHTHTHTHTQTHKDTQTNTHTQPHDHGKFLKNKWLNQKEAQRRRGTELALFKDALKRRSVFFCLATQHLIKCIDWNSYTHFLNSSCAGGRATIPSCSTGGLWQLWGFEKRRKSKTAFVPLGMTLRRAHKNIQGDSWCTHGPRLSRMI